jgi:hypothetical protein
MPIYFVLGVGLTVITVAVIVINILYYGGPWGRLALFITAWVAVIILWRMGI